MKKTPLKRSRKRLRRSPLRRVSPKRKGELAVYYATRYVFLRENPWCEAYIPGCCSIHSTDVHHIDHREGKRLLEVSDWIPICRSCHNWIHLNPKKAREMGLLK